MARFISVPFAHISYSGTDQYGPIAAFGDTVEKQVDAGGASSVYTAYAPCGAAGAAMYDPDSLYRPGPSVIGGKPTSPHCWLMYAPPIIIADTYMSVMDGFQHVNMVHKTMGYSPSIPNKLALTGPILGSLA